MQPTTTVYAEAHPQPDRRHRVRRTLLAVLVLLAVIAVILAVFARPNDQRASRVGSTARSEATPPSNAVDGSSKAGLPSDAASSSQTKTDSANGSDSTNESDAREDALDQDESWHGFDDGEAPPPPVVDDDDGQDPADQPVDLDPAGDPAPTGPCATPPANGAKLLVGPDPMVLAAGTMSGVITIVNCGDASVDWAASTKPSVALVTANGTTPAGQKGELGFTIDSDQWEPGAVDFKIKVQEPGHSHYVDVHAFRPTFGKDLVAGNNTLSAGEGAGGCANQCITKALLRSNMSTPNVSLDIATNTEAKIRVYVSKNAPTVADDVPSFPGVTPTDVSPANVKSWTAKLEPLQPSTKYYVIVKATDANGKSSYRSGSFMTITPYEPGDFADAGGPSGCAAQCITTALITPGVDYSVKHLHVVTHTPAQMQVQVSTEVPQDNNGKPNFAHADFWAPSGLTYDQSWDVDMTGLSADTTYHVIVQAIDTENRTSYRVGQFHTAEAPTYTVTYDVASIHITDDGDAGINRGEVSFSFSVGGGHVWTHAEHKQSDGDTIHFSPGTHDHQEIGVKDLLPRAVLIGFERDADGLGEWCTLGPAQTEPGTDSACDTSWNVADTGISFVHGLAALPTCTALGAGEAWNDRRCLQLTSTSDSGVKFTALLAMTVD